RTHIGYCCECGVNCGCTFPDHLHQSHSCQGFCITLHQRPSHGHWRSESRIGHTGWVHRQALTRKVHHICSREIVHRKRRDGETVMMCKEGMFHIRIPTTRDDVSHLHHRKRIFMVG